MSFNSTSFFETHSLALVSVIQLALSAFTPAFPSCWSGAPATTVSKKKRTMTTFKYPRGSEPNWSRFDSQRKTINNDAKVTRRWNKSLKPGQKNSFASVNHLTFAGIFEIELRCSSDLAWNWSCPYVMGLNAITDLSQARRTWLAVEDKLHVPKYSPCPGLQSSVMAKGGHVSDLKA